MTRPAAGGAFPSRRQPGRPPGLAEILPGLEQLPDGVLLVDAEGRITAANRALTTITGWSAAALTGRPVRLIAVGGPSDEHPLLRALRDGVTTGPDQATLLRPDGGLQEVELRCGPLTTAEGHGMVATVRDVAVRRSMQEKLQRATRMHLVLAETNQAMLARPDRDELLGASCRIAVEHGGFVMAWIGLVNDEDAIEPVAHAGNEDGYLEHVRLTTHDAADRTGPTTLALRSGKYVLCQDLATDPRMTPWRDQALRRGYRSSAAFPLHVAGRVVGSLNVYAATPRFFGEDIIALLQDLAGDLSLGLQALDTEQRRQEALDELRARERRFRERAEYAQDLLYRISLAPEVTLAWVNQASEKLLGHGPEVLLADPSLGTRLGAADPLPERLLALGADEALTVRITRADGSEGWLEHRVVVDRDTEGRPRAIEGIARDITGQRLTELSLQQALEHERTAADRLRALDAMKQTFLEAISHELRTPLSVIVGIAETLERPEMGTDPDRRELLLPRLTAQAHRLDEMLTDLLDLDELTRGTQEVPRQVHDVAEAVEAAVAAVDLGERQVRVATQPSPAEVSVRQLRRVIEALLDNVRLHTPPTTRVWVSCRVGATVTVTVEDDGPGVPTALHQQVFAPFRHGPHGHPEQPGAGIGLALAARLVAAQSGRIWLDTRPGGGARFRIELPVARTDASDGPTSPTPAHGDRDRSADATAPLLEAVRRIMTVRSERDATDALAGFVESVGGSVEPALSPDDGIPVDLRFGAGPPLFARATDAPARELLVDHLPRLAEYAERVLGLVQLVDEVARQAAIEPLTGLLDAVVLERILHRLEAGDVVVALSLAELGSEAPTDRRNALLRALANTVLSQIRALDRAALGPDDLVYIVLQDTREAGAQALVHRVVAQWTGRRQAPAGRLGVGVAVVTAGDGQSARTQAATAAMSH